ncbi:MAG: Ig-like domain repeat protein [Acidimicrobiales bacterium]
MAPFFPTASLAIIEAIAVDFGNSPGGSAFGAQGDAMRRLSVFVLALLFAGLAVVAGAPAAHASNGDVGVFINSGPAATPNPSMVGQSVHIHIEVIDHSFSCSHFSDCDIPTGSFALYDEDILLASAVLSHGSCIQFTCLNEHEFDVVFSIAGSRHVTGKYLPGNFNPAEDSYTQTVLGNPTSTAVSSAINPSGAGQPVTFTAAVTAQVTPAPTGTVTFKDGATVLGTGTLNGGTASYTTSALAAGDHPITAVYNGDANSSPSTSAVLVQTVRACTITAPAAGGKTAGTLGDDIICGSPAADDIVGLGGNDLIVGLGGNDRISGGDGNDTIYGGDGTDLLSGNAGDDNLYADAGTSDYAVGGDGTDTCVAPNKLSCER